MKAILYLPYYLFGKTTGRLGSNAFISKGFVNWRKVNDGIYCPLSSHVGKENSPHKIVVKCYEDLMNQLQDIHNLVSKRASQEVENNCLCLKATIRTDWWLASKASAFKGHSSKNWGNFIELLKFPRSHNDKLSGFVLENAPRQNAKYTSHKIQKEILNIFASNVQRVIHDEIEDSNFCIIIDEARYEAKQEQITIILWFVDKDGFIWEHFFHVMHVKNTTTLILKQKVCNILSRYDILVEHIRGQWYDGASNIQGE